MNTIYLNVVFTKNTDHAKRTLKTQNVHRSIKIAFIHGYSTNRFDWLVQITDCKILNPIKNKGGIRNRLYKSDSSVFAFFSPTYLET